MTRIHTACAPVLTPTHHGAGGSTHIEGSLLPGWGRRAFGLSIDLICGVARATVQDMARVGGRHGKAPHIAYARENGWELERRHGGHFVARRIDDQGQSHMLFIGGTPGGGRAKENTLAKFVKCDKGRCHCHLRHSALSRAAG